VRIAILILLIALTYGVTIGVFWSLSVQTLTFFPIAQSYSWQVVPLANNGGSDNFEITSWHDQHNMRGWIAFNVSSIPRNVWLQSATLRLRLWQKTTNQSGLGDPTGRIYGVYVLTQDWSGDKVNWVNQPSWTNYHSATSQVPPGQGGWNGPLIWMEWDVTSMVRDWQAGVPNYGVVVKDTEENATLLYSTQFFSSHQTPNQSYFPRLVVTYLNPIGLYGLLSTVFTETVLFSFYYFRSWRTKHINVVSSSLTAKCSKRKKCCRHLKLNRRFVRSKSV
jgi:hypothetical protein